MGAPQGKVLVVEDNPANMDILVDYLTQAGFEVLVAEDGQSALEVLLYNQPDIIILDVLMLGMDGFETCRRLKAQPQLQDIPVIFMTALGDIADKVKGFELGAVDYITKPVQYEEMLVRLTTHLTLYKLKKLVETQNAELRKLAQAVEQSANTVVITDSAGRIEYVNPKFTETTGYTVAEAIGQNPRILKSGQQGRAFYQNLWQTITSGREWRGQFYNKRKDGTYYWEEATIAPVHDETGRITHFIAVKEDITARKEGEIALQHYTRELEVSNAELDAFAHTVAHDLKNPLNIMTGYSELLQVDAEVMSPQQKERALVQIQQAGYKMISIIDELLLLATVRKMTRVRIAPVKMGAVVTEAWRRLSNLMSEYQAEIIMPDDWPLVMGYTPWLEEVWVNYLSNAIKYGGRPPLVEVGFWRLTNGEGAALAPKLHNPQQGLVFWVHDNGPGLSAEQQARLFTPFERLEQARVQGHGLGLSIVRRITEKLGGEVGVICEKERGSTFFFTLPEQPISNDN